MTCIRCQHPQSSKFGKNRVGTQRFRCASCGSVFAQPREREFAHHKLPLAEIERVVALLMEGMSIRAVSRITGIHKETIGNLILTTGDHCRGVFNANVKGITPKFVQLDELWAYVGKHQRFVKHDDSEDLGDQYIWLALDSETKMILSYYIGKRTSASAHEFVRDLGTRITGRFQITTDGLDAYPDAIDETFGTDVAYGQIIKIYQRPRTDGPDWYRATSVTRTIPTPVSGDPDVSKISTSHVERVNLTMRMHNRRLTRLTNAYSKSLIHLAGAMALFIAYYNFCKPHTSIRVTPAMESGLTDRVWTLRDLLTAKIDAERAA